MNLLSTNEPIYDFKLNQELLHRGLSFKENFSYDVVLKLDDLYKGLGIKQTDNHDLKQLAVSEKLAVYSPSALEPFARFCVFLISTPNKRAQVFTDRWFLAKSQICRHNARIE